MRHGDAPPPADPARRSGSGHQNMPVEAPPPSSAPVPGRGAGALREEAEGLREAVALRESAALREEIEGLRKALASRPLLDMARGIVMAAGRCTPEEAWQILVETSQHTNIKLRHVAEAVVEGVGGPPPPEAVRSAMRAALARMRGNAPGR
ncbi:ANTAR domain-containing protein [Streptomyces sp. AM 4-1-1]|uniref:ANTAR domain-containing protein n=1 Tax=Streptomyces sp. AM 4-1-1 TaxID=3028710 RepID=UPI0023B8FFBF|nr:ANTAR domain-containing protein [Streptomyces sp. AM 4-1-1]WEH36660.1 ANTAR domain-containing protein [Streptomyces sp. AM 4-1-1]